MENESLHTSQMPQPSPSTGSSYLAGFLKILPVLQWALTIFATIGFFVLSTRDAQTVQASEITRIVNEQKAVRDLMTERKTERDKQVEELKRIMLTKEIFDAYYQNLKDEQLRQRQMLEKIIENQNR